MVDCRIAVHPRHPARMSTVCRRPSPLRCFTRVRYCVGELRAGEASGPTGSSPRFSPPFHSLHMDTHGHSRTPNNSHTHSHTHTHSHALPVITDCSFRFASPFLPSASHPPPPQFLSSPVANLIAKKPPLSAVVPCAVDSPWDFLCPLSTFVSGDSAAAPSYPSLDFNTCSRSVTRQWHPASFARRRVSVPPLAGPDPRSLVGGYGSAPPWSIIFPYLVPSSPRAPIVPKAKAQTRQG